VFFDVLVIFLFQVEQILVQLSGGDRLDAMGECNRKFIVSAGPDWK
jgi:hypothetical protein